MVDQYLLFQGMLHSEFHYQQPQSQLEMQQQNQPQLSGIAQEFDTIHLNYVVIPLYRNIHSHSDGRRSRD
jgi:pantothenate kinase